jgi:hypothetical protein
LYGYLADGIFAAVECGDGYVAVGVAGEYERYGAGLFGDVGRELYGDGECGGGGWELCGPECVWGKRDGGGGLDGFGV